MKPDFDKSKSMLTLNETTNNRDVSTGPLARSFVRSLVVFAYNANQTPYSQEGRPKLTT